MEWTDFLHAGTNSGKLKVDSIIFVWAMSKMAVAFLKNEHMNWADHFNADSDAIVFG